MLSSSIGAQERSSRAAAPPTGVDQSAPVLGASLGVRSLRLNFATSARVT
jgi:hypothetical protein